MTEKIQIMRLPHAEGLPLSTPTPDSLDLVAAVGTEPPFEPVIIAPGERAAIPTGIVVAVPPGFIGMVCPRSGPALRHGIGVLNSIVDHDYRGEVQVILANFGGHSYTVARGLPVARFVIVPALLLDYELVDRFADDDIKPVAVERRPAPTTFSVSKSGDGPTWEVTRDDPEAFMVETLGTFGTEAAAQARLAEQMGVDIETVRRALSPT